MKKMKYCILMIALLMMIGCMMCGCSCSDKENGEGDKTPDESVILSEIQQEADIVTTEVTIRKIAYYDSSKHEHISITDPSTWKYGERKCIVPVDVKVKYGYDLRNMDLESIKIDDNSHIVSIKLPDPKVIDSGYSANVEYDKVVCISTGLRDKVGHETIEKIRKQAYDSVMKQDLNDIVGKEIRDNAEMILTAMVKSMGFSGCEFE